MPDLLNQTPRTAPRAAPARPPRAPLPPRSDLRRRSRVLTGLVAALGVAATGLLIVEAVALIAWIAETRSAAPLTDALRTGSAFWLLGHGGRLKLPAGTAALIPLGLSILFAVLASRAGAAVARVRPTVPRRRTLLASAVAVSIPYALIAGLAAAISSGGGLEPSVVTAMAGALVLSAAGAFVGAARELPRANPKRSRTRAIAAGVVAAGGLLLAVSALVAAIALVTHLSDAAALARPAKAGAVGGFGLLVLQAALAPNAVAWSASYLLGPGFAIGAGTLVSPAAVHLGDVPGLPMLAGLPGRAVPWPVYFLFLVPTAAGMLGGIVMVRRLPRTPKLPTAVLLSLVVALVVGLVGALLAALSGGPVTSGRLATVGPSALRTGIAALVEVGLPGIVGALGLTWYRQRRPGRLAAPPATVGQRLRRLPAVTIGAVSAAGAAVSRSLARPVGFRDRSDEPVELVPTAQQAKTAVQPKTAVQTELTEQVPVTFDTEATTDLTDLTETLAQLLKAEPEPQAAAARVPHPVPDQACDHMPASAALVDLDKHDGDPEPKRRRLVPSRLRRKRTVIKLPD